MACWHVAVRAEDVTVDGLAKPAICDANVGEIRDLALEKNHTRSSRIGARPVILNIERPQVMCE